MVGLDEATRVRRLDETVAAAEEVIERRCGGASLFADLDDS